MALLLNKAPVAIAAGTQNFGPVNVPGAVSQIRIALGRNTTLTPLLWPLASTTITLSLLISIANGPFTPLAGFTAEGGLAINDDGITEIPESNTIIALPSGANRKLNGSVSVTNGALSTNITIEVT